MITMPERPGNSLRQRALSSVATLPKPAIRALARLRNIGLLALEPVDYAARLVNGKTRWPPLRIRRQSGPLAGLENSGAEFTAYLKLLCHMTPESRVLDIGCGFGLLALYLGDELQSPGRYVGIDVDGRAIRWATRHITSRSPQCEFQHLDVGNPAYNPNGSLDAEDVHLSFDPASFDIIVLKSVFTHLRPGAVRSYLAEVRRLLRPGGTCLATFFVLNDGDRDSGARPRRPSLDFRFGDATWRYAVREMPELAIAYSQSKVREMVTMQGLTIKATYPGTWSGSGSGLSYQDILLLTPEPRS